MADKEKSLWKLRLIDVAFVLLTCAVSVGSGLIYDKKNSSIITNVSMTLFLSIILCFCIEYELLGKRIKNTYLKYCLCFFCMFLCADIISCFYPMVSPTIWIFPVLITALSLYSGSLTGIVSACFLILNSVVLSEVSAEFFTVYFLVGVFAVLLFQKLDEEYRVLFPILSTLGVLMVALAVQVFFLIPGITGIDSYIMPIVNLFMNAVLYFVLLRIYSSTMVHRYREKYQTINDQEYEYMLNLKRDNPDCYYTAVHTAYFAERIAKLLQADTLLSKGVSYYSDFVGDYPDLFPPPLKKMITELQTQSIESKEAAIVYLSKKIVLKITELLKTQTEVAPNYNKVVSEVINEMLVSEDLRNANITISEIEQLKEFFVNEKMYYSFMKK